MADMLRSLLDVLRDAAGVFAPRRLPWHVLAIALTFACVVSGFDGWVAETFRDTAIRRSAFIAGRVGLWTPIVAPAAMLAFGWIRRDRPLVRGGAFLAEAEVVALAVCAAYKAVTGRPGPTQFHDLGDASRVFRFGFLRGGLFWGWPSSHVMVAVAGAVALSLLYAERRSVKWTALAYAAAMAVCVSVSFHWFSDVVAAVIVGTVIGRVVGSRGSSTETSR
jgi:membrane-associated phospholipid phosphatase